MDEYLLIESQGPWGGPGAERFVDDAVRLRAAGHDVVLLLIENGVTAALAGAGPTGPADAPGRGLRGLLDGGGRVWADAFSLTHRALVPDQLLPGVVPVEMDEVAARLLAPGTRGVWH
ncbi:DsrE family protein [Streptomyces genisteinicus]|uniref:DsrE family protein n=1 Tax=Streptomyces genisteinicus TaxID=2768068 RepID=A0A7H0HVC2_9ACTN|nr:DsrE family protein [Streptomyces genisteinicus]QNP64488.1 DsrE family protein [Streptomyces genisteinicus]